MPALRKAKSAASTFSHCAGSETSKPVARSSTRTSVPFSSSARTTAAPMPDAPPVTMALRNEDNLPHVATVVDEPVGCGGLGKRELRTHDRLQRALLPERGELARRLGDHFGTAAHQPAQVEALDADVAADEEGRVQLLPPAA